MASIPPANAAFDLMCGHLTEAARDLFADYEIVVRPTVGRRIAPEPENEPEGMAVIGYSGQGIRGALVLMATESAVTTWMAAAGVSDGDAADTLGEFSNMLLGRLKARLLPLGISILATTPTAAIGSGFRLSDPPGPSSWSAVDAPQWRLHLRLDAAFDPEFSPLERRGLAWHPKAGDAIDFERAEEDAT
jgi:CheY-specific phosphatase CheX